MKNINKKMFALILVSLCIVLGAFGQIAMKQGMDNIKINDMSELMTNLIKILTTPYVVLGVSLYIVATVFWLGALSSLDVSKMYPLLSLGYVLTAFLAFAFIHETITLTRWSGIAFIVIGAFLILRT